MSDNHRDTRREYGAGDLRRANLELNPLAQFTRWLREAAAQQVVDATAMTLATADASGCPSARIVLLKHFDENGFVWYTSYSSQKGRDLAANPRASLLFYWPEFERQVRISGSVRQLSRKDSVDYFHSRPLDSQWSAAASDQSRPIANRAALQAKVTALQAEFRDALIPTPEHWGGYVLEPVTYEFWQGRVGRLHDRFFYQQVDDGWQIERLQP